METISYADDLLSIREQIFTKWPAVDFVTWKVFDDDRTIGEIAFRQSKNQITVLRFFVQDSHRMHGIGRTLLERLQNRFSNVWIELPVQFGHEHPFTRAVGASIKVNPLHSFYSARLVDFDKHMAEAQAVFDHMHKFKWDHTARMEAYRRFPGYLEREQTRKGLVDALANVPSHHFRFDAKVADRRAG